MALVVKTKEGMMGYYGHKRRREGQQFTLEKKSDFSSRWMIPVNFSLDDKENEIQVTHSEPLEAETAEVELPDAPKKRGRPPLNKSVI